MVSNLSNELDRLIQEADELMASFSRIDGITEQSKNILQASVRKKKIDSDSPEKALNTMLEFSDPSVRNISSIYSF